MMASSLGLHPFIFVMVMMVSGADLADLIALQVKQPCHRQHHRHGRFLLCDAWLFSSAHPPLLRSLSMPLSSSYRLLLLLLLLVMVAVVPWS